MTAPSLARRAVLDSLGTRPVSRIHLLERLHDAASEARWLLCAVLAVLLSTWTGWAHAQTLQPVPALSARVIDRTGTLSDAEQLRIGSKLADFEHSHGTQIAVLMVPTTAPEGIEAYANRVARDWQIGRRDVGDGLLIVVAKDDRRMRIEVARKLEGAVPDIAAARIIDQQMKPAFRQNNFAGGIEAAIDQLIARVSGEGLPAPSGSDAKSGSLVLALIFGALLVIAGSSLLRFILGWLTPPVIAGTVFGVTGTMGASGSMTVGMAVLALLGSGLVCFLWNDPKAIPAPARSIQRTAPQKNRGKKKGARRDGRSSRDGDVYVPGGYDGGGWSSSSSSSSWDSSSSSDSFSSGGGGDFGGGGASGDW